MSENILPYIEKAIDPNEAYPGYPSQRLVLSEQEIDLGIIPDGPWTMNDTDRPSPDESMSYQEAGYAVDAVGRPLHPFFKEMAINPDVGVISGKGAYWNWGPNYTADAIVITEEVEPRILLIQRGDTGNWALPGGFTEPTDPDVLYSTLRELKEETTLKLDVGGELVYKGIVGDRRTTAHAWAETSAYLLRIPEAAPVTGSDDAEKAKWFRLSEIKDTLFGSHEFLIEQALKRL